MKPQVKLELPYLDTVHSGSTESEAYQEYGSKAIETPIESLSLAFTEKTEPYSLYKTGIFFRKPISEKLPLMPIPPMPCYLLPDAEPSFNPTISF